MPIMPSATFSPTLSPSGSGDDGSFLFAGVSSIRFESSSLLLSRLMTASSGLTLPGADGVDLGVRSLGLVVVGGVCNKKEVIFGCLDMLAGRHSRRVSVR